ncbi:MAG: hypothetical protein ACN6OR_10390 [Stenotrophomonas sp.]
MYEDAAMSKLPPRPDQPISVENGSSSAVEQQAPAWLRGPRWRRWLMIVGLFLVGWTVLFGGWIGIALLRGSTERNAGAVAFNIVLVVFMASVMFLLLQRGIYRWFWHIERRRGHGGVGLDDRMMRFGAVRTDAPPVIRWPWQLRARHAGFLLTGMATLLFIFLPYDNQLAISGFLARNSAGRASAGSLSMLLFAWLPLLSLSLLSMLLLSRQMRRRDAGLLDAGAKLVLTAETNWLFSFAAAFAMTMLLCRLFGTMVMRYL